MDDFVPLLLRHGPLLVFVVTLAARAGAPLPAAPLLVVAGGLAALGQAPLTLTIVTSLLANMLGDAVWFIAGRKAGYRVLGLLCRISLSPDSCVRQSEGLFGRWGGMSLLAAKFVPGVSLLAAPMAGALRMSWSRFLGWNLLAALAWTTAFMGLGAVFSAEINDALDMLSDAGAEVLVLLAIFLFLYGASRWVRRRRASRLKAGMLISAPDLALEIAQGARVVFLDVRGSVAREANGLLPGALPVELGRVDHAVRDLPQDTQIVAYCNCPNEASAVLAASALQALGFRDVRVLEGGYNAWQNAARPVLE